MKQVAKILVGLSICACIGTFFLSSCGGGETTSTEDHRYDVFSIESMLESIQNNKNISLKTDLDLADFEWPLGLTYTAKFNGNNHKISNLKIETISHKDSVGFIGNNKGEIKDLKFENASVKAMTEGNNIGVAVGSNNGTVSNITVTGTINADVFSAVGGVVGFCTEKGNVSKLTNYAEVNGLNKVGGCVGAWHTSIGTADSLENHGVINGHDSTGGCVGFVYNSSGITWKIATLSNCKNDASINGTRSVGGIIGCNSNKCADYGVSFGAVKFLYCENKGNIECQSINAAGIAGEAAPELVNNCLNEGNITGAGHVAGIIGYRPHYGYFEEDYFLASNCINKGDITATGEGGYNGGLFGRGGGRMYDCSNYGAVTTKFEQAFTGGIAGTFEIGGSPDTSGLNKINNDGKVYNLKNYGNITGFSCTGGIFGDVGGRPNWYTITKLENHGNVFGTNNVGGIIGGITTGYQPYGPGSPDYEHGMNIKILYSDNYGKVEGKDYVYGIIGRYNSGRLDTSDANKNTLLNTGEIVATGGNTGELFA